MESPERDSFWEELAPVAAAVPMPGGHGEYQKHATGEVLQYRPENLVRYAGKPFCLRITLSALDLDSCFFVYIDESWERQPVSALLLQFFDTPSRESIEHMKMLLRQPTDVDPLLLKKYTLLRQLFARVRDGRGRVTYHINNGPSYFPLNDPISQHLGTSVWTNSKYNDKILDLVLRFQSPIGADLPELYRWIAFGNIDDASSVSLSSDNWSNEPAGIDRRSMETILAVLAMFAPTIIYCGGCTGLFREYSEEDSSGGGGFSGGGL